MARKQRHQNQQHRLSTLRQRAEARVTTLSAASVASMSAEEAQALVHELQVHQVELEMQNDSLRDAQHELANALDRYTELYDQAPVAFLSIAANGQILQANETAARMFGVNLGTLLGSKIWRFVAESFRDTVYLHLRELLSEQASAHHCEVEMLRADESTFWACLQSTPAKYGPDQRKIRTAVIDISERRLAEQALSLLNIDLRQTLEVKEGDLARTVSQLKLIGHAVANLGEGVLITTDDADWPESRIIYANPAMSYLSGYSEAELVGASPRQLGMECKDRSILENINRHMESGRTLLVESTTRQKDGAAYDCEMFICPLFDENGHRTHFVSIHRNVSARKKQQQELQKSQARLKAILETAAEAIIIIDLDGTICDSNPMASALFGYRSDEMLGRNVAMLVPSPHQQQHDQYISRFLSTGEPHVEGQSRELVALHKEGYLVPISISVSYMEEQDRFAGFISDLTDIKNLQRQVLEVAAEEDRRIGQELHDNLQQQLTGLALLSASLAEKLAETAPQASTDAARLEGGIQRAIDHVQLLSRGLVPVDVDADGLRRALDRLAKSVQIGMKIDCELHGADNVRVCDKQLATQLYRIVQEAVNNMVKHADASRLDIRLRQDGKWLILEVEDDGIGAHNGYVDRTGLGLRMMRYRAQLIGADIHIGPGKHGGTRVRCTLLTSPADTDS
jgi:two-component system sensor kinase FixL